MSLTRCLGLVTRVSAPLIRPVLPALCHGPRKFLCDDAGRSLVYEKKVDEALESLCDQMEEVLSRSHINDYDVSLSSGVLTVSLGESKTYVINKQSANQQIWLSSPVSGPKRYDLQNESWVYHRNGQTLDQLLSRELSGLLRHPVTIKLE